MMEIWKEGGALSRIIEGYEHRPQQEEFASYVQDTIDGGGVLLAEAPTGVGKSLAYLVPSMMWAMPSGARVVVSSNTKNLQDQLYSEDIPKVAPLARHKVRAAVIKGRSNYACVRRWRMLEGGQMTLPISEPSVNMWDSVARWISSTETGDLSELKTGGDPNMMRLVNLMRVEDAACDPTRCNAEGDCFLRRLRKRAWNSQVLCVNHAILTGQLLGRWDVLPPFDVLIVDECHNLPRVAADQLGLRVDAAGIGGAALRLAGLAGGAGGRRRRGGGRVGAELALAAREAKECGERAFQGLRELTARGTERSAMRYTAEGEVGGTIVELGRPLLSACEAVASALGEALHCASAEPEGLEALEAELAFWTKTREDLERLLSPAGDDGVFWIDPSPALRWTPTEVAGYLGPAIDGACEATVLTSATMTVGGSFDYFKGLVGLTPDRSSYPRCARVSSSFDLERSVLFLVPGDAPDPRESHFVEYAASALRGILESTRKKTLVLFTSHSMLRGVRSALGGEVQGGAILAQGVDGERAEITRAFKDSPAGALLGASSFWEGVDFPGEEAEVLAIARLPFPVPSDPVVQARSESLEAEGIDPFLSYHLPEAVMKLKQGFGRLIRKRGDRGVVVVLDPRVVRASYSRFFLDSLPVAPAILDGVGPVAAAAAEWFQGVKESE